MASTTQHKDSDHTEPPKLYLSVPGDDNDNGNIPRTGRNSNNSACHRGQIRQMQHTVRSGHQNSTRPHSVVSDKTPLAQSHSRLRKESRQSSCNGRKPHHVRECWTNTENNSIFVNQSVIQDKEAICGNAKENLEHSGALQHKETIGARGHPNENITYSDLGARPKTSFGKTGNARGRHKVDISISNVSNEKDTANAYSGNLSAKQLRKSKILEPHSANTMVSKMGVKQLHELSDKESNHILLRLASPTTDLKGCLQRCNSDPSLMTLTLEVLAKALSCNSSPESTLRIFNIARDVNFFDSLVLYVVDFQTNAIGEMQFTIDRIAPIISIVSDLVSKFPSSVDIFTRTINALRRPMKDMHQTHVHDNSGVLEDFRLLQEQCDAVREQRQRALIVSPTAASPTTDFKEMSIVPCEEDILGQQTPLLRENKPTGGYEDLYDYLDVQFKLLREDFIGPLREGIAEYIQAVRSRNAKKGKFSDIRVYKNVRIIRPVCDDAGISYELKLNVTKHFRNINWRTSKRLIYGSMVCLSADDFRTLYFATVSQKEEKDIVRGRIHVKFQHASDTVKALIGKNFTMAETSAYYESYRHVLAGLQTLRPGDLPFENHIVYCDNEVSAPAYVTQETTYDLSPLVGQPNQSTTDAVEMSSVHSKNVYSGDTVTKVKLLDKKCWPTAESLQLDKSQFDALFTALTKEFVIIQGPPGTGKTHIGLKIVRALLHNRNAWSSNTGILTRSICTERPMLIVCYTNHALDQFLEGIASFAKDGIVRVGSRSNSETLKSCSLANKRRDRNIISRGTRTSKWQARSKMEDIRRGIIRKRAQLRACENTVLPLEVLHPYIEKQVSDHLLEGFNHILSLIPEEMLELSSDSLIIEWLGIGYIYPYLQNSRKEHAEELEGTYCADKHMNGIAHERSRYGPIDGPVGVVTIELQDESKSEKMGELQKENGIELVDVDFVNDVIEADRRLDVDEDDFTEHELTLGAEICSQRNNSQSTIDTKGTDKKNENLCSFEWKTRETEGIDQLRHSSFIMTDKEANIVEDVWTLPLPDRWRLYRLWESKLKDNVISDIEELEERYEKATQRYKEIAIAVDKQIMKNSTIIGMTTTAAARYNAVLQEIGPKIIIVEEAAEVLEAHILTTLNKKCEHLILIGDHKQLKPNPNVYKLAVKYNLNLSLFERMILNGVQYDCLELQHRMRPDIADCMRHIYERLRDHISVHQYPDVHGISSSVFYINHASLETTDDEMKSHSNIFEAQYAVALCRYLLKQGYKQSQITVLTTYTGQLLCMRNLMPKAMFDGVKVTVVDNYQGEENDIVILSLVRSNNIGKIGFLKISNRICVALSRAKFGFYVIGNFDHLAACSGLWQKITDTMKSKDMFGEALSFYCRNHTEDGMKLAKIPEDFDKAPEGGCRKMCEARLECGHVCTMFCHVVDKEHKEFECLKPCTKSCQRGHKCPKMCFQDCGDCVVRVRKLIPRCGHYQHVPCYLDPEKYTCQETCEVPLLCGHSCMNVCGDKHTEKCMAKVDKTWPCSHSATISCHEYATIVCPVPCGTTLSCGHHCPGSCGTCFQERLHKQCPNKCKRTLICGHGCQSQCNDCSPCTKPCENSCAHGHCSRRCGDKCFPCTKPCAWQCDHKKCTRLCYEPCNRDACNKPCRKLLKCGHECIGLCGEPCPPKCRICDKDDLTAIVSGNEIHPQVHFVLLQTCNHIVEQTALDKYMKEATADSCVQLKGCPICKAPIRKCYRYGAQIKKALMDIETVKMTTRVDANRKDGIKSSFEDNIRKLSATERLNFPIAQMLDFRRSLLLKRERVVAEKQLVALENQVRLSCALENLKLKHTMTSFNDNENIRENFIDHILVWLSKERSVLTEQEIEDAQREIARYRALWRLQQMKDNIKLRGGTNYTETDIQKVENFLLRPKRYTKDAEQYVEGHFKVLQKMAAFGSSGTFELERVQIIKSANLSKEHWAKCQRNHIYAIEETGGQAQKIDCPKCHVLIRGKEGKLKPGTNFPKSNARVGGHGKMKPGTIGPKSDVPTGGHGKVKAGRTDPKSDIRIGGQSKVKPGTTGPKYDVPYGGHSKMKPGTTGPKSDVQYGGQSKVKPGTTGPKYDVPYGGHSKMKPGTTGPKYDVPYGGYSQVKLRTAGPKCDVPVGGHSKVKPGTTGPKSNAPIGGHGKVKPGSTISKFDVPTGEHGKVKPGTTGPKSDIPIRGDGKVKPESITANQRDGTGSASYPEQSSNRGRFRPNSKNRRRKQLRSCDLFP